MGKKKNLKRILVFLICLIIICSSVPVYATDVGETYDNSPTVNETFQNKIEQETLTAEETEEIKQNNTNFESLEDNDELKKVVGEENSQIDELKETPTNKSYNMVEGKESSTIEISHRSHIQDFGWESNWSKNISGTVGKSKRLEAIQVKLNDVTNGNVEYKTHIQDYGWESSWKKNGEISGTTGEAKRLEALQIQLTGELVNTYDIYYRAHVQGIGWLDWAKNGEKSGTQGLALRLEAIEIKLVNKGEEAPGKTDAPFKKVNIGYQSHVANIGWQQSVNDGALSGTTGRGLQMEAINVNLIDPEVSGSVKYRTHVQGIGWQNWVNSGKSAGTTGQNLRMEALQIELTGEIAKNYDIYYRLHVANFGWLGWAKNGEMAGTTGWSYAIEAAEIRLVKSGSQAPGTTNNHYIPSQWHAEINQIEETTKVNVIPCSLEQIKAANTATSIEVTATMNYNGKTTQQVKKEKQIKDIDKNGFELDLEYYGRFQVIIKYKKNGNIVGITQQEQGIVASEYNLAPLSATFPVVYFSLSIWDINISAETGKKIPTIVMLDRPSAYNWDNLPADVYGMPFLTKAEMKKTSNFTSYIYYVKDLYELNPNSKFNLYINDITCSYIHDIIYGNRIPEGQYTITMLSDGSATFNIMNSTYNVSNPEKKHEELIKTWNTAKAAAYKNGQKDPGWGWHTHWDCMYAVLASEPNTKWWVARNNLFTSGDNNVFAEKIKEDVIVKNVNTLLNNLSSKGETTVTEFKNLYNFNDGYFNEAQEQGKKSMMILGTYVYNEKNFSDYARLTQLYYGDEYLYYYKGHPNTPTGLYPEKQVELEGLGIGDIDSNVAAELILFFNPEIRLSGYGTSTFNTASNDMACGLYNMTKDAALAASGVEYGGIDWFASAIGANTNEKIKVLCPTNDTCYLVEFSDELLDSGEYNFAIFNATNGSLKYYLENDNNEYVVVDSKNEGSRINYSSHVADIGWMNTVKEGNTSGTTGKSKAIEAFTANLGNVEINGSLEYRAHVADIGWQNWVREGKVAGTEGKKKPIEAISIKLTGELADKYDIYYRVHSQDYGWLGWAKNGANAGTEGLSKRVEGMQIQLVEKGKKAPGTTNNSYIKE